VASNTRQRIQQLTILYAVFRILAVPFLRPGGFLVSSTPDQLFYFSFAQMSDNGQYPFIHYWMEYPPIFPWIAVGSYKISALFATPDQLLFWFNNVLRWVLIPFEVGNLLLVYGIAKTLHGEEDGYAAALTYAFMFAPLLVYLGWFDSFTLFFLLLGMYGLVRQSPLITALGAGFGFGVKLFPVVVVPAAAQLFFHTAPRRGLFSFAGLTAGFVAAIFVPFLVISPEFTTAFFKTLSGRAAWETVWALFSGYTGYGIVAPLELRTDPTSATWLPADLPPPATWLPFVTVAFAALGLFLWTRRIDWKNSLQSCAFTGITFCMLLLWSKGFSPQWAAYICALAVVLLRGYRGMIYAVLFSVLMVLEWPVSFILAGGDPVFLSAVVILRTLATVLLCTEFAVLVFPHTHWLYYLIPGKHRPTFDALSHT